MTHRELPKKLRQLGCEFVRPAAGSHEICWRPSNRRFTTIPRHAGRDLPKSTVQAILRDLDIKPGELDGA
jgi:predicted RNA binding protein YcfA (HicA-like mRNA interferase family)